MNVTEHYDHLIYENNDPFRDPLPMQKHMDKWDGPRFIDSMRLSGSQTVLEIGVGTGRLAAKVAPHCRSFVGIDLSAKTVERAGKSLAKLMDQNAFANVYLVSDHDNLYEKYGFEVIDHVMAPWGTEQKIYMHKVNI